MKKISAKIVGIFLLVFFFVSGIARIAIQFFREAPLYEVVGSGWFFLSMMAMGLLSLFCFTMGIDFVLVRRIRKLNAAIKNIGKGQYDVDVDIAGRDEIATLAANIRLMANELKANEYLNKDFARNVSHEFKTPLSSIKGYTELIESGTLNAAEQKEYTGIILEEIDRLTNLSHDLLQISLLDSVNIVKKEDTFRVDEQIRSVLQMTQLEWEGKELEFDLDLEEVTIRGNRELTFQIWQNLIVNAIKYSRKSGLVSLSLHPSEGLRFEIRDAGIGISEADQKRIFTPFFVADKSRNQTGTGLGLSITKKIVEKLGGRISFESHEGSGTTFTVVLDVVPEKTAGE